LVSWQLSWGKGKIPTARIVEAIFAEFLSIKEERREEKRIEFADEAR
jgi:hypothetical protein